MRALEGGDYFVMTAGLQQTIVTFGLWARDLTGTLQGWTRVEAAQRFVTLTLRSPRL
jgi:hypothetical protein